MGKKSKQYKAVFRARIDFKNDESHWGTLLPGHSYHFEEGFIEKISYTDITNESIRIINSELKPELQKYTDISI